jgi:anti-sigma B factor antagonist
MMAKRFAQQRTGTVCQITNKGKAMRGLGLTIEPLAAGAVRVALRGELDLEHAYTFDEELKRVEEARPSCLVLDLRGLSFLDSCGLARLLAARRRAGRERRRLLLVRGGPAVSRLLAITAVGEKFEQVPDVPDELRPAAGLASQA